MKPLHLLPLCALLAPSFVLAQKGMRDIPDPDPRVQEAAFKLPPGAKINLFASDPMISKPVQMNWDSRGRLWLVSSGLYPHIEPFQEEKDQVLVLEDADHNGVAEKVSTYADGLHIPTAVIPGDGGAYVANSTEILFLPDADGDLRADRQEVILSGFGTEDTHHLIHTFRYGPEGMLYFNQSIYIHSHVETPWGVRRLLGGGVWRFRPETRRLEVFAKGLVNTWGQVFDEWGQSFLTDGAGGEGINFAFPGAVFVSSPGAARIVPGLNPGSPKHCGLVRLEGKHVPEAMRGCLATADFRGSRINVFRLERNGSSYKSTQQADLVSSTHRSFRPIDLSVGPDGAIYIADWYNPIIQHGEVDFRDPRRDHVHGRIWRVTFEGRPVPPRPDLALASNRDLLDLTVTAETWAREFARQELRHRGAAKVQSDLDIWADAASTDRARLEAVWNYQAINQVPADLVRVLLTSTEPMARAAALRVVYQEPQVFSDAEALLANGVHDTDPMVRLWAISGLAQIPTARAVGLALEALNEPLQPNLDFALWTLIRERESQWVPAYEKGELKFDGHPERLLFAARALGKGLGINGFLDGLAKGTLPPAIVGDAVKLIAETGGPGELSRLLSLAGTEALTLPILTSVAEAVRVRKIAPPADVSALNAILTSPRPGVFAPAAQLCGLWKVGLARETLASRFRFAGTSETDLRAAAEALRALGGGESLAVLREISLSGATSAHQAIAVGELVKLAPAEAANIAVALLQKREDGKDPTGIFETFLRHPNGVAALEKALSGKSLPQGIAVTGVQRASTTGNAPQGLIKALQAAGKLKPMSQQLSPAEMAAMVDLVNSKGNAANGEAIYRRMEMQCVVCHAIGGQGGKIGPDLISIGSSAPVDYLVDSLLNPTAKIKEGYHTTFVTTKGGASYTGGIDSETGEVLVIRDALGALHRIPKAEIASKQISPISMMPAGLTAILREDEFIDLVRFLSELGKEGAYKLQPSNQIRAFTALLPHIRVRDEIGHYGPGIFTEPVKDYQWVPFYSQVNGLIPVGELPQQTGRGKDRLGVIRFDVPAGTDRGLGINDTAQVTLFSGKEPISLPPAGAATVPLKNGAGASFTLIVNVAARQSPLELRVVDGAEKPAKP